MIDRTGWVLPLVITHRADCSRCLERRKMERENDGLTALDSYEHNVSAGSNIPSPASTHCLTCTAFTRLSVCLAPCPDICVCCPLLWVRLSTITNTSSLAFCHSPKPILFRIYIPVLMRPLSAVLVPALSFTSPFPFPLSPFVLSLQALKPSLSAPPLSFLFFPLFISSFL